MLIISILLWLLFGAVVGWIAGAIMKSKHSLIWNIIFGIIGSLVGGFLASLLGFGNYAAGYSFDLVNIIISIAGACLVIYLGRFIKIGK